MTRIPLGPVQLDITDVSAVERAAEGYISRRQPSHIVTLNALMYNLTLNDPELAAAVSRAALIVPDSVGMVWAARFIHGVRSPRLTGIDLIDRFCGHAARSNYRLFLLGAAPGVAEETGRRLAQRFPGLTIAGTRDGYFTHEEETAVIDAVVKARPHFLFVALAMPHQEKWIHRHLNSLGVPVVMGVGGSFDVISGRLRRAPRWMQRCGIEWFFRLLQQPSRIFRMKDLPLFVWNMIKLKAAIASRKDL